MDVGTCAMVSLLPKLDELLNEKYKLQGSSREDVEYLSREMKSMSAVLRKLAEVPPDQLDRLVKIWAWEVRQLSYSMELAVNSCFLSETSSEVSKGLIKNMGNLFKKGKACHEIVADTIKGMKLQVKKVAERRARYNIDNICARPAAMTRIDPRLGALYKEVTQLVGIDGQKDQDLMKLLSDGDNRPDTKLKIVSVVGFGGLGKTTLVKAVYDKMKSGFDRTAFVSAGQNADVKRIIRDIIQDITLVLGMYGSQLNTLGEQQLITKLGELLENKRYLIVIDDIWNKKVWDIIKLAFSGMNSLGSRIITTTRIVSVSEACCSSSNDSVYQMEPLSDDDSKKLFYDRIFSTGCGCPHEYDQVSIDILNKCGGVPLAVITMASMLISNQRIKPETEWHVLLSSISHASIDDPCWDEMLDILSFSYYELSPHQKTCLLYSSIFPGALPIIRDRLVKKLVAEGIVTQETKLIGSTNKYEVRLSREISPEQAASHCLDELVDRNVIHPLECNRNGEVISYHIHPLMHSLLKEIARYETFAASLHLEDNPGACLRGVPFLSIYCPESDNQIDLSSMALDGFVHSLTVFGHANKILPKQFQFTQVLDLEGCKSLMKADVKYICSMVLLKQLCLAKTEISELPPEIGNLQNLQGLDVGGTQITEMPTQIGKLKNLKTLDARKSQVKDLPDEVVQLTRLAHLLIGDDESCEGVQLPNGIGKMESLQQLCTIDLKKCSASSLEELAQLPHLKEIAVVASDDPEDTRIKEALFSFLNKTIRQRSLVVYSDFRLNTVQSSSQKKYLNYWKKQTVLKFLKVPICIAGQHLGMLDIRVCKLDEGGLKILGEMPRLQSLIVRLEVLPTKMIPISCKGFAKLESFLVDCRMPRVTFEKGAMPKLEYLELKLYGGTASEEHMCINHLLNLQKVTLRYAKWYATNKGVRETTEAVKTECKEHPNEITLCITEEDKDGNCTMEPEIFQENRVASSS
uniref:RGH1 n=1 Tax=Hordeum vulgare subsp. vulgare TaxID=112509 RepID=A0A8I7B4H6_HORVV